MNQPSVKQNRARGQVISFMQGRLASLDVFRGFAIVIMILLNNLGNNANYSILLHADWNGLTLADVVFPFFLFVVGAAIPYSLTSKLERGQNKKQLLFRIGRRTIILFALGVFLNGYPYFDLSTIRIMGVLQRIALCYFAASAIFLTLNQRKHLLTTILLALLYWILMSMIPVPGYGAGVLDKNGNLAAYIDRILLPGHLYAGTWDPEGFLSTVPAIATTMLGVLTTEYLMLNHSSKNKSTNLLLLGILMISIGTAWNLSFPINKNLWTSSYVALTGGIALIIFDLFYYIIDLKKRQWWVKPLIIFGLNAITAYVLSEIMNFTLAYTNINLNDGTSLSLKALIFERYFASWAGPLNGSLFYAIVYLLLWLGIMTIFYKRRIFIKI